MIRLVNSKINLLLWYRKLPTERYLSCGNSQPEPERGGVMAIGPGQPRTGHGAAAVRAPAPGADVGADHQDDLIRLSCHVGPDGLAVVTIGGDLDLATVDRTVRYVSDIIDRHDGAISADLSGLAFCDACGLGALVRIATHAEQAGRRIEFTKPSRAVARIMRITGVDERLLMPALAGLAVGAPGPAADRG
jgi:anti-anti-sigma factor